MMNPIRLNSPLAKLDNILHTVDNLEAAVRVNLANVTGVEPAVLERLGGVLGVVQVAGEHVGTTDANFTAGVGLVLVGVPHLGNIKEADLVARLNLATGADVSHVHRNALGGGTDGLREAVTLDNITAEADAQELVDSGRERSGARRHVLHLAAHESPELAEDEGIVNAVVNGASRAAVGELGGNSTAKESTLKARGIHLHLDG